MKISRIPIISFQLKFNAEDLKIPEPVAVPKKMPKKKPDLNDNNNDNNNNNDDDTISSSGSAPSTAPDKGSEPSKGRVRFLYTEEEKKELGSTRRFDGRARPPQKKEKEEK